MTLQEFEARIKELQEKRDAIIREMEKASLEFNNAHQEIYDDLMSTIEK